MISYHCMCAIRRYRYKQLMGPLKSRVGGAAKFYASGPLGSGNPRFTGKSDDFPVQLGLRSSPEGFRSACRLQGQHAENFSGLLKCISRDTLRTNGSSTRKNRLTSPGSYGSIKCRRSFHPWPFRLRRAGRIPGRMNQSYREQGRQYVRTFQIFQH